MKGPAKEIPLFREEVIRERADALFGSVLLPQSRLSSWLALASCVLTSVIVVLFFTGEYARKVHVVGWLATQPGVAKLASPSAGTIAEIWAQEGALVRRGDQLLSISTSHSSADVADVEQKIVAQLTAEREGLLRQMDLERSLSDAEKNRLAVEVREAQKEIDQLSHLKTLKTDRLTLANADQKRKAKLVESGLIAQTVAEQSDDAVLAARSEVEELDQRIAERRAAVGARQMDISNLPLKLEKTLSAIQGSIRNVEQRLVQQQSAQDALIRAPIDGRVTGLSVHIGQSVQAGMALLVVIPEGATLQAELLVPSRAVGFLRPGLEVLLQYDSFPYQKFGQYRAVMSTMSRVALAPDEQSGPLRLAEPAYLVTATLQKQTVRAHGRELALRGGMTVHADIRYDRRRLYEWILEPLASASLGLEDQPGS